MKGLREKKADMIKEGTLIVAIDIGMTSNLGTVQQQTGGAQRHLALITQERGSIYCGTWYLRVKPDFNAMR